MDKDSTCCFRKLSAILVVFLFVSVFIACEANTNIETNRIPQVYYIDSNQGNDSSSGFSETEAWKTLSMIKTLELIPGDTIKFKRGSTFSKALYIDDSGRKDNYIVLTDYGNKQLFPPIFTNTVFKPELGVYGNCIRLQGSYIIVENLYFEHSVAELSGTIGFVTMWELGAIYVDETAQHCIIRNNEMFDCGVGIKSYGSYCLISNNYIHDCNRILKEWSWGPLGIWLGGDYQEVCYNRIFNYKAVDQRISWGVGSYGGGADGGAIEIDDGRVAKSHIEIHHNYTKDNQGFIEVTWTDVVQNPLYENFIVHHNVSDDYQQFIAMWCGSKFKIENNTIVRRKVNVNDWGVFNITEYNSKSYIRNNVVVVENDVVIFNLGNLGNAQPNNIISNNLYYAETGELNIGLEGPGTGAIVNNPLFVNYQTADKAEDFSICPQSPAINRGVNLGYTKDYVGTDIPQQKIPDIGAFEYQYTK